MNVWIIFVGETLPVDNIQRPWRYGLLAEMLSARGHHVTRWAPTFNHAAKIQRYNHDYCYSVNKNYCIKFLFVKGYKKNICISRLRFYSQLSLSLKKHFLSEVPPDIIICGMPSPEMCLIAVRYAKQKKTPIVIDIRDLWPDIFIDIVPNWLRLFAKIALQPLFLTNRYIFRETTCITAISPKYLGWGLSYAKRLQCEGDQVFKMAYKKLILSDTEKLEASHRWLKEGVNKNSFICCFFGSINRQFDIKTIIYAAKSLMLQGNNNIQFIICGDGMYLSHYKKLAFGLANIIFPGWVSANDIAVLMGWAKVGLAPYYSHAKISIPNKPAEYFSSGLPILSSLRGELKQIILKNNCGIYYNSGDVPGLINAIQYLQRNPKKRQQMGDNAKQLFETSFSADKVYNNMVNHLEKIVGCCHNKIYNQ